MCTEMQGGSFIIPDPKLKSCPSGISNVKSYINEIDKIVEIFTGGFYSTRFLGFFSACRNVCIPGLAFESV